MPPPGDNNPISVEPLHLEDSVPTDNKIELRVQRLITNQSGGHFRMRAEQLQGLLKEACNSETEAEAAE